MRGGDGITYFIALNLLKKNSPVQRSAQPRSHKIEVKNLFCDFTFMSSHHIVRDNQESALLILHTDSSSLETVQELLEWSPSIIVDESQLDRVLTWGIKIDMVLFQDNNEEETTKKVAEQWPIKLIPYGSNENPVDRALDFLVIHNYPSVNILTHEPDILHQLLSFQSKLDITIIQKDIRWSLIRTDHYSKKVADHTQVYILNSNFIKAPVILDEGKVYIQQTPPFWVGEALE